MLKCWRQDEHIEDTPLHSTDGVRLKQWAVKSGYAICLDPPKESALVLHSLNFFGIYHTQVATV